MPPLASPESDIGDTSAEIPYWWRVRSTQIWDARELARRLGERRRISFSLSTIFWHSHFATVFSESLPSSKNKVLQYYMYYINQDNNNLGNKFHECFPEDPATKVQSNPPSHTKMWPKKSTNPALSLRMSSRTYPYFKISLEIYYVPKTFLTSLCTCKFSEMVVAYWVVTFLLCS